MIKELFIVLHALGIDLGKTVFHLVGLDSSVIAYRQRKIFDTKLSD